MGIGPIVALRPITMVRPASAAADLTGVFAIEFRGQEGDETYSPNERAARGLEDEESDYESASDDSGDSIEQVAAGPTPPSSSNNQISFFA